MLSAEQFIKNHSVSQKESLCQNYEKPQKYDLKVYKSYSEIANDLKISRQTVAKRMRSLGFYVIEVDGAEYYIKDSEVIKFAFYILNMK